MQATLALILEESGLDSILSWKAAIAGLRKTLCCESRYRILLSHLEPLRERPPFWRLVPDWSVVGQTPDIADSCFLE